MRARAWPLPFHCLLALNHHRLWLTFTLMACSCVRVCVERQSTMGMYQRIRTANDKIGIISTECMYSFINVSDRLKCSEKQSFYWLNQTQQTLYLMILNVITVSKLVIYLKLFGIQTSLIGLIMGGSLSVGLLIKKLQSRLLVIDQ